MEWHPASRRGPRHSVRGKIKREKKLLYKNTLQRSERYIRMAYDVRIVQNMYVFYFFFLVI